MVDPIQPKAIRPRGAVDPRTMRRWSFGLRRSNCSSSARGPNSRRFPEGPSHRSADLRIDLLQPPTMRQRWVRAPRSNWHCRMPFVDFAWRLRLRKSDHLRPSPEAPGDLHPPRAAGVVELHQMRMNAFVWLSNFSFCWLEVFLKYQLILFSCSFAFFAWLSLFSLFVAPFFSRDGSLI